MASSAIRGTTEHIVTKSSMVSYRLCHFWARNWPKTTLVLQAARRSDQRRHDDLLRTQARLRGLCAQAQVLPERSCTQDRALHSRSRSRQGPRDCKDRGLRCLTSRTKEGRDAVRSSEALPQARPIAPVWAERGQRRVPLCRHSPKSAETGESHPPSDAHVRHISRRARIPPP